MAARTRRHLTVLERSVREYGTDVAQRKQACLRALERTQLPSPRAVLRLHEALCFLRAYPDGPELLEQVERMLESFHERRDLARFRPALADTGIAGTDVHFPFFQPQASWLARRCGSALTIDWKSFEGKERLRGWLEAFALEAEVPALYDVPRSIEAWIAALKRADESDAQFLVRSVDALPGRTNLRRAVFDGLDVPFRIDGRRGGLSRTRAHCALGPVAFQQAPLRRERPDLARAVRTPPLAVRDVSRSEARALVDLARDAMATRSRDLDSFSYASEDDVRLIELGEGLQLACMGLVPEQRIVVEALYAFLILKNGVPTGYALASALYRSSDIAYNVFETFRGGEAAHVYGRLLGAVASLLGSDSFCVTPYQLGHGNAEGLASGAWWFYQRIGYRARDPEVLRLMRAELAEMQRDPRHRSSRATLSKLSSQYVFWSAGKPREDVIGRIALERISLAASELISRRFGSDRERARRVLADEAAARIGLRGWKRWAAPERGAWERWSPLVLLLPGVERWTAAQRHALARVVRAKGGRRETDYLALFERHTTLKRALLALVRA